MRTANDPRADAELSIHHRRIVRNKVVFSTGCAALFDKLNIAQPGERVGELEWVCDGRRAQNEDWVRAVELAYASQASDDMRKVAAEDPAVGVQLVDDNVIEVLEQLKPARMVREDA